MRLCVVESKECWVDAGGRWSSDGGFPFQMAAIASLFDEITIVAIGVTPREGGIPLPPQARIVPLARPVGEDGRRKLSVVARLPYYVGRIATEMRAADVVHAPLPGDMQFLGMILALGLGKPLIARYGGSWYATAQTTVMNRVTRGLMRRCAGGRRVMLATGESGTPPAAGMEWIFATAISNRELANIAPKLNRGLATPPRLVYAGRLSPEKGVSVLITALARLKETGFTPLPLLSIAGDGPERLRLEREARDLGCRDRISFLGQLDRGALAVALHDSDVCVQPSLTEGFSKAWLDAMAHGVPVIASRVGAASSVIGECGERGWLVPPGNVDALADTLANVLSSSINWPLVRAACRTYVEQRTLERWAERIGSICARQWNVRFEAGRLHA